MHFFEWLPVAIFYYILPVLIVIKWLQFIRLSSIAKNYSIPLLSSQTVFQETVSFIVPARNEEFTIEKCLRSIMQSGYPVNQIIVVDDQSIDKTSEIVKSLQKEDVRIELVTVENLPGGWTGKNYAQFIGALKSKSEWLIFIDSDVVISLNAVNTILVFTHEKGIDFLSISPFQICEKYYEKLLQPEIFNLLNYLYPFNKINTAHSKSIAANGSFMIIKRRHYFDSGGHESVKQSILEDVAFAKKVHEKGYRVSLVHGEPIVASRMYRSFLQLWRGWSKNLYLIIKESKKNFLNILLQYVFMYLYPLIYYIIFRKLYISLLYYVIFAVLQCIMRIKNKHYFHYHIFYPFYGFIIIVLMINSYIQLSIFKRAQWKQRIYYSVKN
ncbi:MAG: hypothetical protein A2Y62_10130 [Candidatus Fischerbacteria bacterium RBG_13_37_8]|uniref:Glycosyltransferase 2-like domain-containing protein n=1 Tax=Candidatus Fischerbacteria bacterium RBG_13_37_8 TaxID=1817863 RepID=A0A1F5V601_9BACT|nr:MAG: hypothetical protein A2Y62_10130 [Candidatus Fischerbacteria bacterium RBG_13_37_8]